jgi:glycerol-3-phosphate dehydrogenase (NAD(P)+)
MTMLPPYSRISVLGGGAWGTALANAPKAPGPESRLWAREHDVVNGINQNS